MFGKPLTAAQWNVELCTSRGREVYDLLRPFHECPIDLRPPSADLADALPAELRAIGVEATSVTTVPLGALLAPADALHPHMRKFVRWDVAQAVRRSLKVHYWDHLRDRFKDDLTLCIASDDCEDRLIRTVSDAVSHPHHAELERRHPHVFATAHEDLPFFLLTTLLYHVGFVARGKDDLAALVAPFTRRFLQGNFPLGSMPDGAYAVLTA